tara:strand:- start:392 stop:658 length:267 start_codon:yes stop_codon:yes gene_type:complete
MYETWTEEQVVEEAALQVHGHVEFIIKTYNSAETDLVLKDLIRVNNMVSYIIEEALKEPEPEPKLISEGNNVFSIGNGKLLTNPKSEK